MDLLTGAARVIDGCSACLHQPPPPFISVHTEHVDTEAEELERAATRTGHHRPAGARPFLWKPSA